MKKTGFIIFLLGIVLILSPYLSSGVLTNIKEEYKPLETMIIKIDGNFLESIKQEDIFFYSERIFYPMIYDINKIGNSYYLYAILPNNERNYTLIIKDAYYFEEGKEKREDLEYNFLVKGEVSSFTINPGFIITDKDFSIKTTSNNKEITIKSTFEKETKETIISAGDEKNILFSIKNIKETGMKKITLEADNMKYEIPVYIFVQGEEEPQGEERTILVFYPEEEIVYTQGNTETLKKIYLYNNGTQDVKDIKIIISSELKNLITVTPSNIELIEAGNYTILNVIIKSRNNDVSGLITAESLFSFIRFPLSIKITGNQTLINQSTTILRYCFELGGQVCKSDEYCESELEKTIESPNLANCCVGGCKKLGGSESGGGGFLVPFILIILLLGIIYFLYKKFNIKKKSPEKVLKERTGKYEEKFKSEEVRGNLKRY